MKPGKKIAEGREAEIYEWPPDGETRRVLKLFFGERSEHHANKELAITRAVQAAGAPCPAIYDGIVEHDGRFGVVFERIYGKDMLAGIGTRPWRIGRVGRALGHIHARMHSARPGGLPDLKEVLAKKIGDARELTPDEKEKTQNILAQLPDGDRPYHGDMHPGNVMVQKGEPETPVIIDWPNAAVGDPIADVARTQLLLTVGWRGAPSIAERVFGRFLTGWMNRAYTETYFRETGASKENLDSWLTVAAAARLSEYIPAETKHLLKLVRSGLSSA